ncbi:uncharacterized protein Z519_00564 [Cladophialophora bantiana CBS 173.52]|uniref:Uncharacterized protein n=1 Tax=Cladophialophora bantiana (strain ATCC 10958 / CBS 173.52 / CDC B-1940 / NIH 8579) TaxID=1442370 RepID=A0A0D2FA10_CLAB1|nr:uncharacterized protein Z519_00564 [Cladophialophora bantiana CBS 173.52]KIW98901.1 hypothetical protein Z519_00564 [Cladophialophora bantiana CBS 173.52]
MNVNTSSAYTSTALLKPKIDRFARSRDHPILVYSSTSSLVNHHTDDLCYEETGHFHNHATSPIDGFGRFHFEDASYSATALPLPNIETSQAPMKERLVAASFPQKLKAGWCISGNAFALVVFVIITQMAFGILQCVKYSADKTDQAAFGRGVVLAKG